MDHRTTGTNCCTNEISLIYKPLITRGLFIVNLEICFRLRWTLQTVTCNIKSSHTWINNKYHQLWSMDFFNTLVIVVTIVWTKASLYFALSAIRIFTQWGVRSAVAVHTWWCTRDDRPAQAGRSCQVRQLPYIMCHFFWHLASAQDVGH